MRVPEDLRALPIASVLEDIADHLQRERIVVVEAAPGAGKTTGVPRMLLETSESGRIYVTQPRRIAARLAAHYVAGMVGEKVGARVGYTVRYENRTTRDTRLVYATEGTLLRRLQRDRSLADAAVVVLDEFHERHVEADTILALLRAARADLKLMVMSATIDAADLAARLDAPHVTSQTRRFDVEITHDEHVVDERLEVRVARAARQALRDTEGDVLVFLPGVGEIERARKRLESLSDVDVLPLHGRLPLREQQRAVSGGTRRKIVLATNVAETSVTIDGVVTVIDSGLARVPEHDPTSGLSALRTRQIAQSSAVQRAGRAGRTRPGRCIRLYTKHELTSAPPALPAELLRTDLTPLVLQLAAMERGIEDLLWLDPPPADALTHAHTTLRTLGALDDGGITAIGRAVAELPVHPRLGRVLVEARERGALQLAARAVAAISERLPTSTEADSTHGCDAVAWWETIESRRTRLRDRVRKAAEQLGASSQPGIVSRHEEDVRYAFLLGYPDRVARRTARTQFQLCDGKRAALSESSHVRDDDLIVAIHTRRTPKGDLVIELASAIEADWLLDLGDDALIERVDVEWNTKAERVDAWSRLRYRALTISEDQAPLDAHSDRVTEVLKREALAAGPERFADPASLEQLANRSRFARERKPDTPLPELDTEYVAGVLGELCAGRRSFAELRELDIVESVVMLLPQTAQRDLQRLAPVRIALAHGRKVRVHYESDRPPWIESYLQDFFGMADGPRLGGEPVTLHLLAPNRRAVQVTQDLAGFWERHYPGIRKTLSRRYPKHAWPEDPLA